MPYDIPPIKLPSDISYRAARSISGRRLRTLIEARMRVISNEVEVQTRS